MVGLQQENNLRHANTKGLKPLGQPHLQRVFCLVTCLLINRFTNSAPANAVSKTCIVCSVLTCSKTSETSAKGQTRSLITDISLAWGPCAYVFQALCMLRMRKRTQASSEVVEGESEMHFRLEVALTAPSMGLLDFKPAIPNPSSWHLWLVGEGWR